MERAATADRELVGRENAQIASGWGWEATLRMCLDALPSASCKQREAATQVKVLQKG